MPLRMVTCISGTAWTAAELDAPFSPAVGRNNCLDRRSSAASSCTRVQYSCLIDMEKGQKGLTQGIMSAGLAWTFCASSSLNMAKSRKSTSSV